MKKNLKRKIDLLVLSDIHLGTYGCHAEELIKYLQSIKPKTIVLNGDIIDGWNFSKNYFPPSHLQVISELMNFLAALDILHHTGQAAATTFAFYSV